MSPLRRLPCPRCKEPDAVSAEGDVCWDCGIAEAVAWGTCRECLRRIVREAYGGPRAQQHLPGCTLAHVDHGPRDEAELLDVLRRMGEL